MTAPTPGLVMGRYRLEAELGRGGMGAVYQALDLRLGRHVALKFLLGQVDPARLERFRREGEAAARLDHPGLVRVHDLGQADGRPFLVYELVPEARPLGGALRQLELRERVRCVRDAARALGHAHRHGVVHRDVKPENILLDGSGGVHVSDFGLSLLEGAERLTRTGALVGTPFYLAPELLQSGERVSPAADVWALGVILYEALTGTNPFAGATLQEVVARVAAGVRRRPRQVDPSLPAALERACLGALAQDPTHRLADGEALARELDAWLEPGSASARWGARAPLAAGVALAALLGAVGWWGRSDGPLPPGPAPSPSATARPSSEVRSPARDQGPPIDPAAPEPAGAPLERLVASIPDGRTRLRAVLLDDERALTWGVPGGSPRCWEGERLLGELPLTDVVCAAVSPDGATVAVLSEHRLLWLENQGALKGALLDLDLDREARAAWSQITFVPGGAPRLLLGGSGPGQRALLLLYDLEGRRQVARWTLEGRGIYALAVPPDGTWAWVAHGKNRSANEVEDGLLTRWSLEEGVALGTTSGHGGYRALAVSPDGRHGAAAAQGRVELFDLSREQPSPRVLRAGEDIETPQQLLGMMASHPTSVAGLAFPDDEHLLSCSGDPILGGNEVRLWRVADGAELVRLKERPQPYLSLALSPSRRRVVLGVMQGPVEVRGVRPGP